MFHNLLMTSLTPLRNINETSSWENRPFTTVWPENQKPRVTDIKRPIAKKRRRQRTAFTTEQTKTLEKTFYSYKYINAETRRELATSLNLNEKSIKIWFQNRRMKEKKSSESDSSLEITTSELSPQRPERSESIKTEVPHYSCYPQDESDPESGQSQYEDKVNSAEPPHYHFCQQLQYQRVEPPAVPNIPFAEDGNVYPTNYYPSLDYYYNYQYDFNSNCSNETQWSANSFDLNFF